MNNLLLSCAAVSLAVVIGSIVFQSFIVAPSVFQQLDQGAARAFLRTLFPRFFRINAGAGVVASAALLGVGASDEWPGALIWTTIGALVIAVCMLISLALVPSINAARDRGEAGADTFASLHRVTVVLTLVALLLAVIVLAAVGTVI